MLDFWPLLRRKVVIRSVVLEDPEINLVSDPDGPWNFENPETENSKNTFPLGIIDKVVIHRGSLIASNLLPSDAAGPVFFEAHDITSELDSVDLAAIVNPNLTLSERAGRLEGGPCPLWRGGDDKRELQVPARVEGDFFHEPQCRCLHRENNRRLLGKSSEKNRDL